MGPEKQYAGQRSGHVSEPGPRIRELIMSLTGHNNGTNAIVKFTRLLQETRSQLTAPPVPKNIFYQPAVGKPKPADLQIDCETEM